MKWFAGSVNEAVVTSKSKKAVFVVFVAGQDEVSNEAVKVINSPEISSYLEKDDFVAIRLESGSEDYRFFAQIYQLVPVPSLFFIGNNGSPLEVVAGTVPAETLKQKIDSVLSKVGKGAKDSSNAFIREEQSAASQTATNDEAKAVDVAEKKPSPPPVEHKPAEDAGASSSDANNAQLSENNLQSLDEKMERAKKLIEAQKQAKLEKEREEEQRRELERRNMGKEVQSARRRQQDMELQLAHEERIKEKAAEQAARERVRQQIEQDKLERKQREKEMLRQVNLSQQEQDRPQASPNVSINDGITRIQFRLPSGDAHLGKFEPTNTLKELRNYIIRNIKLPFQQFYLSTSFPRRDLNTEEDHKTLVELQLVPTAVILILPFKNVSTNVVPAESDSFLSRFMWALFSPFVTVYNYLYIYFRGGSARGDSGTSATDNPGPSNPQTADQSAGAIRRNLGGPNTTVRARGNIHRLHADGDDNDENNTWNGNSTQQM